MGALEQILTWFIWLFNTVGITVLIAIVIYTHRKNREEHDDATQERRTIVDRIERLRKEIEEREQRTNNYIIFNHTRNQIVEQLDAYVTRDGGWKITGAPSKIPPEFVAREVKIYVVLKDGEEAGIF